MEKSDLTKTQERQEMAEVIGKLSQSGLNRLVEKPLKEASEKRQQAEAIAKTDPQKANILNAEAQAIEANYGIGSPMQMGVRAATAALQGLATGNLPQAGVGAISPYANKGIKEATTNPDGTINTEANLIAHTVLGILEAKATGNNALVGAVGALTAEATAPLLMKGLYGEENPKNLTEAQKQTVADLSAIVAGISSGVVGDSTASGIAGADIGKRAVENNSVGASYAEWKKQEALRISDPEAYAKLMQEQQALLIKVGATGATAITSIVFAPEILAGSSIISAGFGGGSELVGQMIENKGDITKVDKTKIAVSAGVGVATKGMGVWGTATTNAVVEVGDAIVSGENEPLKEGGKSFISSLLGGGLGKMVEIPLNKRMNPDWKQYTEKTGHLPYGISEGWKPSYIPSVAGNAVDNAASPWIKSYLDNRNKDGGVKNDKK